jgi:hypothetical protein
MARHDILGLEFSVVTRLNRQDKQQRVLLQSPVRAQLAYGRDAAAKRKSRLGFPKRTFTDFRSGNCGGWLCVLLVLPPRRAR